MSTEQLAQALRSIFGGYVTGERDVPNGIFDLQVTGDEVRELAALLAAHEAEKAQGEPVAVPLTDEDVAALWRDIDGEASRLFLHALTRFARAIERAHGIGKEGGQE